MARACAGGPGQARRRPPPPTPLARSGAGALGRALLIWLCAGPALADGFARLEGHGGPVKGIAVSADGNRALTASFDYAVGLWSLPSGAAEARLEGHGAGVNAVAFLPGGRALSAGDDFALILWNLATGQPLHRFEGHKGKVIAIAVSPDGARAATAGWDGWIGLWDLEAGTGRFLEGHQGAVNDVVFDGTALYSAGYDGTLRLWDTEAGTSRALIRHGFGINRLVPGDGWLAYGAVDGATPVVTREGEPLADLSTERRPILAMAVSPDGSRLAIGDGEGHVLIAATDDWSIERDFRAVARGPVWALAWTGGGAAGKGARLISGGLDDWATIWPVDGPGPGAGAGDRLASNERSFLRPPGTMENGERQFARKCSICHTLTPDGANRAGPTLWRLFGRRAGTVAGYSYSPALTGSDLVWSAETIDGLFREGPDHYTPGSKMPMQRIAGAADRADLIDFLARNTGPRADEEDTQ